MHPTQKVPLIIMWCKLDSYYIIVENEYCRQVAVYTVIQDEALLEEVMTEQVLTAVKALVEKCSMIRIIGIIKINNDV